MTTMRDQFATTANALLDEDGRTAIVLAEISLGLFRDALRDQAGRVMNVGIMEPAMVGIAAGFALEGFRPIVHTIEPFLTERALEQVKLDLANQALPATLVTVGASYDYSTEGTTHHAPGAVHALLSIPGMEVYVPGAAREVDRLLRAAHASPAVSHVRTSVQTNREARDVEPGRLSVVRHGRAATVIAVGPMLDRTLEAVADLDVAVLYATMVAPFDARGLREVAGRAPLVIAVEPFHQGTLAFALTEALADRPARIVEIGVPRGEIRHYGMPEDLDRVLGLDAAGIRARIERLLGTEAGSKRARPATVAPSRSYLTGISHGDQ